MNSSSKTSIQQNKKALEKTLSERGNAALDRLTDELKANENARNILDYSRMHNRHNRSHTRAK